MEEERGSSRLKRPLDEEHNSDKPPAYEQRRVRFPKGKKVKRGDEVSSKDEAFGQWMNAELAAKERAKRRIKMREKELFRNQGDGDPQDLASAEVHYEEDVDFKDDGIPIEPFNLEQEEEEGYFDAAGNYVEYVNMNEIKDAWLDSVDVHSRLAEKKNEEMVKDEEYQDLSTKDTGKLKRRIASLLQPGETVIQALKRLKGSSRRMSEDTKRIFDQLTDDAVKLMENGDYNVYHEKRETFEREAEGYERLACAEGTSSTQGHDTNESIIGKDLFPYGVELGSVYSSISNVPPGLSENSLSTTHVLSGDDGDKFDMFGDDDDGDHSAIGFTSQPFPQPAAEKSEQLQNEDPETTNVGESDYMYDESSGFYYSSSLGYYYDPASGLYCCATSGKWYSFNEQTGAYDEIQNDLLAHQSDVSESRM